MRIGLLRCDEVGGDRAERFGGYLDLYSDLLGMVEPAVELTGYDVVAGQLPTEPGEQDGWLISGARTAAYDEEPWLTGLLDLVARLYEARAPMVGICFGHQVIAQALGGEVKMAEDGWGIGIHRAEVVGNHSWMIPKRQQFDITYSHSDQVTALPEGATLVAYTNHCPIAAFTVDDHILGIQGHPEFSPDFAADIYRGRSELYRAEVFEDAMRTLNQSTDSTDVAAWILSFLKTADRLAA
ncbi:MAG TPA: GMP synthase [Acidimicrobiaceae bacterium]|jgi:GMP synthase-like glutamine amidotransferase|nr:GMP synthase [Acidimicrobiaceae bacterium]MDP7258618.1 gamma-glutamyl-gamma-aminobutyrate hydrolase family protein [Acidimicrobiales bacterium]HCV35303.1 GMP synthase [Acidimicrobiaceae bacterium]HJO79955.1 gamma-glutamyl-gamma-aminobutyrate hydrolase family protein [Acidimicrobiales bacterium]|tara:strand:+ start:1401 stop:2120 length:720 start_codon:yes stop_codon:yes gene_type:complete